MKGLEQCEGPVVATRSSSKAVKNLQKILQSAFRVSDWKPQSNDWKARNTDSNSGKEQNARRAPLVDIFHT